MKWVKPLLKWIGSLKELFVLIGGYLFGYNRGVDEVVRKVEVADFESRKKQRDRAKKVLAKWDRIRAERGNVIELPIKKDSSNTPPRNDS